ncbi:conserved protein of unknown function [Ectopseudomonas oleovorans]|uniref:Uncharacterized protein n=1 Tax=Ectopseudomonas oleovorans TaxID=301 RepID=A0A653B0C9_ECTOL|nr:conserved protein of unknown function [Pseudomonas oleovorans]
MNLDELTKDFRVTTQDKVEPYLFERSDVARWLIEAEQEACIRGRLLHDSGFEVDIAAGETVYPLSQSLYEIDHLGLLEAGSTERCPVKLVSREWLDDNQPGWRDRTDIPRFAIQSDTSIRLVPTPRLGGTLKLEGYRLPLRGLSTDKTSKPEINQAHHRHLVNWALYRAFSMPDSETLDLGRAEAALAAFTNYFGDRPDSDLRRITRQDVEHHNKAWV